MTGQPQRVVIGALSVPRVLRHVRLQQKDIEGVANSSLVIDDEHLRF
jgi:hypothetical protein